MIIDPNSPSWRERIEADIRQAIISSGGVLPIQTNPSWKARIEELVNVFTYLIIPANGSITNLQIAANAAIAWSKISKVGALPGDVGAATAAQGVKADSALQATSWALPGEIGATTANTLRGTTLDLTSTTASTSTITGAGKVAGGLGVVGNLNVGGSSNIFGSSTNAFTFLALNGSVTANKQLLLQTAGSNRWNLYTNGAGGEAGGNAGSSIFLSYYSDAGAYLGDVWAANRTGNFFVYSPTTYSGLSTFTGAIVSKNITSTGTRIGLAPLSAPAGGGFRYDYTAGASVALTSVGPSSNIQFAHGAAGVGASSIFNSGGSLALQWDAATATAQGNVLLGTGTNNSLDRLQVDGNISLNGAFKHTGSQAGFYAATAIAKPTVSGSRSSGAALTSLLSALSSLGLITDTTTA